MADTPDFDNPDGSDKLMLTASTAIAGIETIDCCSAASVYFDAEQISDNTYILYDVSGPWSPSNPSGINERQSSGDIFLTLEYGCRIQLTITGGMLKDGSSNSHIEVDFVDIRSTNTGVLTGEDYHYLYGIYDSYCCSEVQYPVYAYNEAYIDYYGGCDPPGCCPCSLVSRTLTFTYTCDNPCGTLIYIQGDSSENRVDPVMYPDADPDCSCTLNSTVYVSTDITRVCGS
jgi:hypothetical protein